MAKTLQEQLLAMGLTDKKKAKQAEKQKKKSVKEARKGADVIDEAKVLADKANQDKNPQTQSYLNYRSEPGYQVT
jgi:hypothetical protein